MTLSVSILISLVVSLTTTPMMCALHARLAQQAQAPRWSRVLRARLQLVPPQV
jgi:multidrug efflux pump subunit AcrB